VTVDAKIPINSRSDCHLLATRAMASKEAGKYPLISSTVVVSGGVFFFFFLFRCIRVLHSVGRLDEALHGFNLKLNLHRHLYGLLNLECQRVLTDIRPIIALSSFHSSYL
jgi:hypothetical protein